MTIDEKALKTTYNLVNLSMVSSSTQISTRTSAVAKNLDASSSSSSGQETIVVLTAASKAASKLISIAEIAKRDFVAKGEEIFQYNALSSKMLEMPRKLGENDAEESDDAFEGMGAKEEDGMVKRKVPVLTIYLATTSVKELKAAYGEQT
ncbi:hypothetical protein AC578_7120 [Pseudocercospora eumusae]|uniref:DNA/RNA-binding protein Alba-like domain-containing protein n=1 Tax=Pseudocercospora eumusae TaxID=321146 RepID=A0A139HX17_9PEZI|nr:hypothetical protein AC578_7120 [Pseudocercospora eumusae]